MKKIVTMLATVATLAFVAAPFCSTVAFACDHGQCHTAACKAKCACHSHCKNTKTCHSHAAVVKKVN